MLCDRFKEFAHETELIGQERVAAVNDICDQLIAAGHSDAATIAEWKDGINEAWTDLLELIDTRTQALAASWELHKFFHDCKETLLRIHVRSAVHLNFILTSCDCSSCCPAIRISLILIEACYCLDGGEMICTPDPADAVRLQHTS